MTKATRITSQEYHMNQPSVFIYVDGKFYGDLVYVDLRQPQSVNYFKTATSSDSDRGFTLEEVSITEDQITALQTAQNCYDANRAMVNGARANFPTQKWSIKRGKVYEKWVAETAIEKNRIKGILDAEKPYADAKYAAYRLMKNIIKSL